jgi:hypothetical protein
MRTARKRFKLVYKTHGNPFVAATAPFRLLAPQLMTEEFRVTQCWMPLG